MTDAELIRFNADDGEIPERVSWATGLEIKLPDALLGRLIAEKSAAFSDGPHRDDVAVIARDLRMRAAFTPDPPVSGRLGFHYHRIPAVTRDLLAKAIGRVQRLRQATWSRYPSWPLDLSADFVADLAGKPGITFSRIPVLLTHDIDSAEGLKNLVAEFLPIEEAVGARSANYIVPCAWPLDQGLLSEIAERGHEIGIHGYDHANRTPFCIATEREARVAEGYKVGARYGAVGYRSPSLLRTSGLLMELDKYYRYDASIPTSGGPFPVPNSGCASARPWQIGSLWEIPLTLPRDGSLRFLGYSSKQIAGLWKSLASAIAKSGGLVCILTHCENRFSNNPGMLAAYRQFLDFVAENAKFQFVRPFDLLADIETRAAAIEPTT